MAKWSYRSTIYKVTLLLMYFIFLVYGLAFAIPTWIELPGTGNTTFLGLWALCTGKDSGDFAECSEYAFGNGRAWLDGTRGVWLAGMFLYVMAVVISFVENCCGDRDSKDYGLTGALVLLAGTCGAAGVITVAVSVEVGHGGRLDYLWGYMLACITSGLSIILAIVLLITRNIAVNGEKGRADRTADYVFAHKPTSPYYTEYTNHGYTRDDVPLANGVTHHYTPSAQPYTVYGGGGSLPHPRNQAGGYAGPTGYNNGYDMGRAMQRHSMAESADLSNGYTTELINAEQSMSRTNVRGGDLANRGDYVTVKNDYYHNGSRPY